MGCDGGDGGGSGGYVGGEDVWSSEWGRFKMKGKTWGVMVVMVVAVVGMWEVKMCGAVSGADCKEERRVAINACKPILYGKDPTPACCERIRVTHIECVCPVITPKLAALVDVNRMIELVKGCGRRLPRHYKCGSITFP
eukprot:XP_019081798.1 PREDICTED: uncharacterized protein LOC109124264 [Vitis vinifera]